MPSSSEHAPMMGTAGRTGIGFSSPYLRRATESDCRIRLDGFSIARVIPTQGDVSRLRRGLTPTDRGNHNVCDTCPRPTWLTFLFRRCRDNRGVLSC